MRTEWKNGVPSLVHYLVTGSDEHITQLEVELEEIQKVKREWIKKQSYEEAAKMRDQEKEKELEIEIAKNKGMQFIGPYHNKPSKKLAERKGARIVSYNLVEIK